MIAEAREVEAFNTVASVLLLIVVIAEAIVPAVLAVPASILAEREVEAASIFASVFAFTTPAIEEEARFVFAFILATIDEEAVVISDCRAREPESSVASDSLRVANDHTSDAVIPDAVLVDRWRPIEPGVVRVDVATFHTAAVRVPKSFNDLVPENAHTAVGIVEPSDVEAVRTVDDV